MAWGTIYRVTGNGHAYADRAQQANGAYSQQKHETGTPGGENSPFMRTQIPAKLHQSSWQAGPRFSEAQDGHIRAWVFLASSPWMSARAIAKIEAPPLAS